MCLIIVHKSNSPRQSEDMLKVAAETNKDGIGVAYSLNKKLIVKRGFESFEEFYKYYCDIPVECPMLVHFRAKSAGSLNTDNLHPFIVDENLCFAFNGTISALNIKDSDKSDTFILNEDIIQPLRQMDVEFWNNMPLYLLLDNYIGSGKMVFLTNTGDFIIFNEELGSWDNKDNKQTWYSNMVWQDKLKTALKYKNAALNVCVLPQKGRKNHFHRHVNYSFRAEKPVNHFEDAKKKFYLVGDKYYRPLSEDDLYNLSKKYSGLGIKKLKGKRIIARLAAVPDQTKLDAYWAFKIDQEKEAEGLAIAEPIDDKQLEFENPVLSSKNLKSNKH